jgi:hypothetical protein
MGDGIGVWNFPSNATPSHELFMAEISGGGLGGITWWDVLVNWPALSLLTLAGQADINIEFKIGLRQKGSVGQTIPCFVGGKSLRFLSNTAEQSSLRSLLHF